jgi:hypothetical protein
LDSARIELLAETRWSGPSCFCSSPRAIIRARRAFACASDFACDWLVLRSETADKLSNPTATTVSKIISDSVITKAKPSDP